MHGRPGKTGEVQHAATAQMAGKYDLHQYTRMYTLLETMPDEDAFKNMPCSYLRNDSFGAHQKRAWSMVTGQIAN